MSWVSCHGFSRCRNRVRTGQRNFDGWCSKCRRSHKAPSKTIRPDGCYLCTKPRWVSHMCPRCARAYDRWLESPANRGDTRSLLQWAALRVRRFQKVVSGLDGWTPCSDAMPSVNDGDPIDYVNVFAPARGVDMAAWDGNIWQWRSSGYAIESEVTHWRTLPSQPLGAQLLSEKDPDEDKT